MNVGEKKNTRIIAQLINIRWVCQTLAGGKRNQYSVVCVVILLQIKPSHSCHYRHICTLPQISCLGQADTNIVQAICLDASSQYEAQQKLYAFRHCRSCLETNGFVHRHLLRRQDGFHRHCSKHCSMFVKIYSIGLQLCNASTENLKCSNILDHRRMLVDPFQLAVILYIISAPMV